MNPCTHVFMIKYTCPRCKKTTTFDGTIVDILMEVSEAGLPICPECGDDMEFVVIS